MDYLAEASRKSIGRVRDGLSDQTFYKSAALPTELRQPDSEWDMPWQSRLKGCDCR
jgi:hypothetical protein